ncbi:MAG: hypothetical protein ACOCQY_04795 [Halorhabdus sp.]
MSASGLEQYRRPEYTGSNRCLPCTVVNGLIAVVIANTTGVTLLALEYDPTTATLLAVGVLGVAGVQIWIRGYLIPGTPRLTSRYFPPWLLRSFGKEPFVVDGLRTGTGRTVTRHHQETDTVSYSTGETPLALDQEFRAEWRAAIDDLADVKSTFETVFAVEGRVELTETDRAVIVSLDGRPYGRWVSRAALRADLGAGTVLAGQYDAWPELSAAERGRLLGVVRRHIDVCPACGGVPASGTAMATSCCRELRVETVSCQTCGVRLFEAPFETATRLAQVRR